MIGNKTVRPAPRSAEFRRRRVAGVVTLTGPTTTSSGVLILGLFVFGALLLGATEAAAQYTVLGGGTRTGIPDEEALRQNVEDARWNAGPFRVQPWFGLRDVSYVRNQQSLSADDDAAKDQLTVTAGAGVRAYAPVGAKTVWAAHLLPEYVWWQDDDSKDGLNGRYGVGLFTYGNRVQLEMSHRLGDRQSFFSDEVQELTTLSTATSTVGAEVEVARGVGVYGSWQRVDFEGDADDDAAFALLDRVEDAWSAGVRLRSHRGWSVGVGVRESEGEFDDSARNLSFDSEAVTFDLSASVRKFNFSLAIEDAELTPRGDSELEPVQQTFGDVRLGFQPRSRLGFELYGQRQRSFSILSTRSLIVSQEQGLRVFFQFGSWNLRLLGGTGTLDTDGIGGAPDQSDDYDVVGVSLGYGLKRLGRLQLNAVQRSYDVGLLGSDRDVTTVGLSIQLGELAERLSVGESESLW